MDFPVISRARLAVVFAKVAVMAAVITYGFAPTCLVLERLIPAFRDADSPLLMFPLLASLFYIPTVLFYEPAETRFAGVRPQIAWAILSTTLAAFAYGLVLPGIVDATALSPHILIWFVVSTPLGEELLFRGWFMALCRRISDGAFLSETNPLSVSVWLSAFAFSVWHLQNLDVLPVAVVTFQMFYTFFFGLWLGVLREQSGSLLLPMAAHFLINSATVVGMLVPRLPW